MYKQLVLTKRHKDFIQRVCDLEQNSIISCHTHDQEFINRIADNMNAERLTVREYQKELSNAFYEFQVVLEEPEKLTQMDIHYLSIFQEIVEIFHKRLSREFPDVYPEFMEILDMLTTLKESNISLN